MNTSALVKHYDRLTPWERVPLLIAAVLRDDPVEQQRLGSSAPRASYRVPDYWGLLEALTELGNYYLLGQLDLAVLFGEAAVLADQPLSGKRGERMERLLRMLAFRLVRRADGWRQLCTELAIDPEVLVRELPGYPRLCRVLERARELAFSEEEALAYLREAVQRGRSATDGPAELRLATAADAADELRAHFRSRLELWGTAE